MSIIALGTRPERFTDRSSGAMPLPARLLLLFSVGIVAGAQNALAGGGSFLTLPALIAAGLTARAANITSTVALLPGQVISGWAGRAFVAGAGRLSFRTLVGLSLVGGAIGAVLLLATPASFFARLVPWLVLFATAVFAWGSFARRPTGTRLQPGTAAVAQFVIAIYGGYFGGGIGFLMLAALTMVGLAIREAAATKNALAGVMNITAVLVFVFSADLPWLDVAALCGGSIIGGLFGAWMVRRVPERPLRIGIVAVGLLLTIGLFVRRP
jgi:uncharacterized protein